MTKLTHGQHPTVGGRIFSLRKDTYDTQQRPCHAGETLDPGVEGHYHTF